MPAHRKHKTKKAQQQASAQKSREYYERNQEAILAKKRMKYTKEAARQRKLQKQENDESKWADWEAKLQTETNSDSLKQLRSLEENINQELLNSGSEYLERLFTEFLAWTQSSLESNTSPLELTFKIFSSMLDSVAKIGNVILNEYGAYAEWKECQRLTRRIRYLIQCVNEWEVTHLEHQTRGVNSEGRTVLEVHYLESKLEFQQALMKQWLDRVSVKTYITELNKY
ncbi:hypothetical protein PQX77_006703 [Marasmius sp. AFHP31]|nr:hypothetical protein PQX77_006703 [Marasmius sp. AFHP31]